MQIKIDQSKFNFFFFFLVEWKVDLSASEKSPLYKENIFKITQTNEWKNRKLKEFSGNFMGMCVESL